MGLSLIAQEGKVVNVYLVNNDYIKIAPFDNREDYLIIRNIDGKLVIENDNCEKEKSGE